MVRDAARGGGHLFQAAQAGRGLAGIEHLAAGACDRVAVPAGERGDAAQPLQKIERSTLRGQQRTRASFDPGYSRAGLHLRSATLLDHQLIHASQQAVDDSQEFSAGDDQGLLGAEGAFGFEPLRYSQGAGDIARANVFVQGAPDRVNYFGVVDVKGHPPPSCRSWS